MECYRRRRVAALVAAIDLERLRRRRDSRRRFWVHPVIANRQERGQFWALYANLRGHEDKFFDYTRMSIHSFDELLVLLSPHLQRQDTFMRDCIPPVERLVITLRYLATGQSLASLHFAFLIGKSTASMVVQETCVAIWDVLHPAVMAQPQKEDWLQIADHFLQSCNFPNCVGAIDGKHIRVQKPIRSGSQFFNYKKYLFFLRCVTQTIASAGPPGEHHTV
ncbi:uncharacterized protein LOC120993762 [Bufo bufo]|uniref:uncharacterized protein LOC120993762 n=1 Tax=Bufo bufo TaxID=8384 RepID=UPI001ABE5CC0|nr:uncharacterized protein LOC120993762 [Bufo bufo]